MATKICSKCKYCQYSDEEYICDNEESENYGLETDYDGTCDDFEVKKGKENED